jgi:hypothetical protein
MTESEQLTEGYSSFTPHSLRAKPCKLYSHICTGLQHFVTNAAAVRVAITHCGQSNQMIPNPHKFAPKMREFASSQQQKTRTSPALKHKHLFRVANAR